MDKKMILTIVALVVLTLILVVGLFFRLGPCDYCEGLNDREDITTLPTVLDDETLIPNESIPSDSNSIADNSYDYQTLCGMYHRDWIDAEKFYSSYIEFLNTAIQKYEDGTFEPQLYSALLTMYDQVGESLIGRDENDYGKVVYDSARYTLANFSSEHGFTAEYFELVKATVKTLENHKTNPNDYPFTRNW